MNKILFIGDTDELSLRSTRLLDMLSELYPEMEVERMNLKDHPQMNGHECNTMIFDEVARWVDSYELHAWKIPASKRKPKPFYRQGERW